MRPIQEGTTGTSEMSGNQTLESFIARIWLECGPNGDPKWRGHVRHVQGEEETYFQDLDAMSDFIEQVSGVSGPSRTSGSQDSEGISNPGPGEKGRRN